VIPRDSVAYHYPVIIPQIRVEYFAAGTRRVRVHFIDVLF
jgi:hypothetical protein